MKLKHRFRKALFAFFKDEIIKITGVHSHVEIASKELKFTHIRSEIILSEEGHDRYPVDVIYQQSLQDCKVKLFDEAMKHIQINESSIMDTQIFGARRIEVSLFIGQVPNNQN